jgi:hypothetical protein
MQAPVGVGKLIEIVVEIDEVAEKPFKEGKVPPCVDRAVELVLELRCHTQASEAGSSRRVRGVSIIK